MIGDASAVMELIRLKILWKREAHYWMMMEQRHQLMMLLGRSTELFGGSLLRWDGWWLVRQVVAAIEAIVFEEDHRDRYGK